MNDLIAIALCITGFYLLRRVVLNILNNLSSVNSLSL